MTAFETFQQVFHNRWNGKLLAGAWKKKGLKVVGYPDTNCPEELIMAAGCLPLLMTGDPDSGLATAGDHIDSASTWPVRYFYEAVLTGRYDFIDLICTTGGDRWLANIEGFLREEKHINPALKFGELYFIERLRTTYKQHRDFNLGRLHAFKDYLEEFSGKKITDRALSDAFAVTNETRRLLKQVSDLRKDAPLRISGCEALVIIMASMLMPKAEYNQLLRQFLAQEIDSLPRKDTASARLFVSGSIVDNLQLYNIIESLPAIVVGEDTAFGDRYAEAPISTEVEPMEALADRYTYKPLDPWMLGMKDRIKYRVDAAITAKAQGEIFVHLKNDDCIGWDYPDQKKELEGNGLSLLVLEDQDYSITDPDTVKNRIATFVASIHKP